MGRTRNSQPSFFDDLFKFLLVVPVWVGPVLAFLVFVGFRWIVPALLPGLGETNASTQTVTSIFSNVSVRVSPWLGGIVLVVWIVAEIRKLADRKRLDSQSSIESIRELDWSQFEALLAEAFRRDGYTVNQLGGSMPDGGVDLRITKNGNLTLVQCKHWRARKVSVKIARELLGVVTSEQADSGILVASGDFTSDAIEFAQANPITLIDGAQLEKMIRNVQRISIPTPVGPPRSLPNISKPTCPKCNSPMVLRTSKKGANAGSKFWGCSRYPDCRGTRNLPDEVAPTLRS